MQIPFSKTIHARTPIVPSPSCFSPPAVLVEVVVSTLSEAALVYLDEEEGRTGRKVSHLVLQGLLELLHNILRQMSAVVRSALQVHARRWFPSLIPPPTAAVPCQILTITYTQNSL